MSPLASAITSKPAMPRRRARRRSRCPRRRCARAASAWRCGHCGSIRPTCESAMKKLSDSAKPASFRPTAGRPTSGQPTKRCARSPPLGCMSITIGRRAPSAVAPIDVAADQRLAVGRRAARRGEDRRAAREREERAQHVRLRDPEPGGDARDLLVKAAVFVPGPDPRPQREQQPVLQPREEARLREAAFEIPILDLVDPAQHGPEQLRLLAAHLFVAAVQVQDDQVAVVLAGRLLRAGDAAHERSREQGDTAKQARRQRAPSVSGAPRPRAHASSRRRRPETITAGASRSRGRERPAVPTRRGCGTSLPSTGAVGEARMNARTKAIDTAQVRALAERFGTPCYVYYADVIRERIRSLAAFDVVRYAQKASSNLHLLRLAARAGARRWTRSRSARSSARCAPASSPAASRAEIVYTADVIDAATLERVVELGIPVNAGSEDMLDQLGTARGAGTPSGCASTRASATATRARPTPAANRSKHGIWHENLDGAAKQARRARPRSRRPAHAHRLRRRLRAPAARRRRDGDAGARASAATCARSPPAAASRSRIARATRRSTSRAYFEVWDAARRSIEAAARPRAAARDRARPLSGGGVGAAARRGARDQDGGRESLRAGRRRLRQPGAPGDVRQLARDLDRSPRGGDAAPGPSVPTIVAGPLCESGDVFTQGEGGVVLPRDLPEARVGDLVVFHDTGAYGASMASNYNTRPYAPEVLRRRRRSAPDPPPPDPRRAARARRRLSVSARARPRPGACRD